MQLSPVEIIVLCWGAVTALSLALFRYRSIVGLECGFTTRRNSCSKPMA